MNSKASKHGFGVTPGGKILHVLVVDDDRVLRENLGRLLEVGGFRVTGAENGAVALNFLAGAPIDLVLTDVAMPEMDGIELIHEMVKSYPRVPVLVMSGSKSAITRLPAAEVPNVKKILPKPVAIDALISSVIEVFSKSGKDLQ